MGCVDAIAGTAGIHRVGFRDANRPGAAVLDA
jgi:hypothetical protein